LQAFTCAPAAHKLLSRKDFFNLLHDFSPEKSTQTLQQGFPFTPSL